MCVSDLCLCDWCVCDCLCVCVCVTGVCVTGVCVCVLTDMTGTCHPGQFQCLDHRCIDPSYVCDGDRDCANGADEQGCSEGNTHTH